MAQLLLKENCTVTIVHSKTKDLKTECLKGDIVVAAVGVANLVKSDWVKAYNKIAKSQKLQTIKSISDKKYS
mgnify:CR=1 FL=1